MSNKKRAIERANLLLERRFLIEATTGTTITKVDSDGNQWYVGKSNVPNSTKFKMYVKLKNETNGVDPLTLEKSNPDLWKKISDLKNYFVEYNSENDVTPYMDSVIKSISTYKDSGTAGTAGTAGIAKLNIKPGSGEVTQDELINTMAQGFEAQGIGKIQR